MFHPYVTQYYMSYKILTSHILILLRKFEPSICNYILLFWIFFSFEIIQACIPTAHGLDRQGYYYDVLVSCVSECVTVCCSIFRFGLVCCSVTHLTVKAITTMYL